MQVGESYNPKGLFTGIFIPESMARLPYDVLSPGAKLCFGRLCWHIGKDGECFPSREVLAEEIGVSVSSVRDYLRELESQKFIRRIRGGPHANDYDFPWHEVLETSIKRKRDVKSDGQPSVHLEKSDGQRGATDRQPSVSAIISYITEDLSEYNTPPTSSSEETPRASVEFFLRRWGTIRGLKRPSASEREKVRERWTSVSISEEDLDCALDRFASWLKTKPDIRNPLLAFLKDPNSWGRSLVPKETTATIPPVECAALVPTQSTALALTWSNDPEYQAYAMAAALKGRRMTPAELEKGYELFAPLDAEKRRLSTEDYAYLADAASAPHFIPAPWKHLHGSPWENLRLPKKTETQLKYDRAVAIIREKQASGEWKS